MVKINKITVCTISLELKMPKFLNTKNVTGADNIPLKLLQIVVNVIGFHHTCIINEDLSNKKYSKKAKIAREVWKTEYQLLFILCSLCSF